MILETASVIDDGRRQVILSVIVPVRNGQDTMRGCLESLFASAYRNFEVIVVDDGSTDSTGTIVSGYPCRLLSTAHAGPAAARNCGVEHASGDILLFLDADVTVRADSLGRVVSILDESPQIDALFGSYGKQTIPDNVVSVYKNLLHHYTHQTAQREAATFHTAFGAIRRASFHRVGGFDRRYRFLEDVELGMRLHQAGMTVVLERHLQFTHCKQYTLGSLIRSDLFGRAIPWTRLILSKRLFRNDLNTRTHNVFSVPVSLAIAAGIVALPVVGYAAGGMLAPASAALAALVLWFWWLNRQFLAFLTKERDAGFALKGALLLWFGYLYSALGLAVGTWQHFTSWEESESGVTCPDRDAIT